MFKIEDKTSQHFGKLVEDALEKAFSVIPNEDLKKIDKILLLDECEDEEFKWTGGFYCLGHDGLPTLIELYPPKIIAAKPFFLPKTNFSKKYSIVKMFLHELGHHKYGIQDMGKREAEADKYMLFYLLKLYGGWVYFFDFMSRLDYFLRKVHRKVWGKGVTPI